MRSRRPLGRAVLWVYFIGVPSTVARSGKPDGSQMVVEAYGPLDGPVAVVQDGRCPAQEQEAGSSPTCAKNRIRQGP
jgi:hypothetical protein